ncbi:MAG TPA: galactose-1-phosphate uridylyltransferase [Chloroflexota bacterium]
MSELRQDPLTRDWVVIAPERARRADPVGSRVSPDGSLTPGRACPFCPGNELQTPAEVWRLDGPTGDWLVRVVPNLYTVLGESGLPQRVHTPEGFVSMPGVGRHEVVIESPDHALDLARANREQVRGVLEAYRARSRALRAETGGVIVIFRNHGVSAGSSQQHPHSQIIATPVVPIQIRHRFDVAIQHYDDTGHCLYLDNLDAELRDGRRIVHESPRFVAFQPFAASAPYETWLMPREHVASFGDIEDTALDDLATSLRGTLAGLRTVLNDPDYNLIVQSAPSGDEGRLYFVWHIRIVPHVATTAGFELGTGMQVNPSVPEQTAPLLREAVTRHLERVISC